MKHHSHAVLHMYQSLEQIKVLKTAVTRFDIRISTAHVIIHNMNCQVIICLERQQQVGICFFSLNFGLQMHLTMHEHTIKDKVLRQINALGNTEGL